MAIGPLHGARSGPRYGIRVGPAGHILVENRRSAAAITWTVDATSGISVPADSTEWTDFIVNNGLSIAVPTSIYLCQDSGSPLVDVNGVTNLTTYGTGHAYQQTETGWSRKAIVAGDGVVSRWDSESAALPNGLTDACFQLLLCSVASSANRATMRIGFNVEAIVKAGGTEPAAVNINGVEAVYGAATPGATIRPWGLKHDPVNSEQGLYTDQEKLINPAYAAMELGAKFVAIGSTNNSVGQHVVYAARWDGADGEMSTAAVHSLYEALGFSVAWAA